MITTITAKFSNWNIPVQEKHFLHCSGMQIWKILGTRVAVSACEVMGLTRALQIVINQADQVG